MVNIEKIISMKIKELKLYTNKLELKKKINSEILGFEVLESNQFFFTKNWLEHIDI